MSIPNLDHMLHLADLGDHDAQVFVSDFFNSMEP